MTPPANSKFLSGGFVALAQTGRCRDLIIFQFPAFLRRHPLLFSGMRLLPLLLAAGLLASCKTAPKPADPAAVPGEAPATATADGLVPATDVATVNAHFKTYKTNGMVPADGQTPVITPANSKFIVDLDGQRAYFYVDNKLTAASSIASGRKYYRTETGDFSAGQKDLNHRSSSYGNFVSKSGGTIMSDVTNGFDPTPVGGRFEGSLMKYFIRFHKDGKPTAMGFHRGLLPGYPASHGCVRLPEKMAAWFFSKVPQGTPILVRGTKNGVPYGASQGRPKRSPKVHSSLKNKPASAKPAKPADPGAEAAAPPAPAPAPGSATPTESPAPADSTPPPAPEVPAPAASAPDASAQ